MISKRNTCSEKIFPIEDKSQINLRNEEVNTEKVLIENK